MDLEFLQLVVVNVPNFIGLLLLWSTQREINARLLSLIEKCLDDHE